MPFFTVFGALSDRIGRKWLMMAACLLAVVTYIPIYHAMQGAAGNNVTGLRATPGKAPGQYSLTPLTTNPATQEQVAAKEASNPNVYLLVFLIWIQVIYVCMIYGPIAAYLVEAFPARIRYTALSLPYHIGNGVFGGLLPLIGLIVCAKTGNIYAGLYYPMTIAVLTLIVGTLFLKETHGTLIWNEYDSVKPKP
jgi:MFS family permease